MGEFVSAKQIAEHLGIMSQSRKPNAKAVLLVLQQLRVRRVHIDESRLYAAKCISRVRKWFHERDLPETLTDGKGNVISIEYTPCKGGKPVYETAI